MNHHEQFFVSADAVPTQPPESLPPTEGPQVQGRIYEGVDLNKAQGVYSEVIRIGGSFATSMDSKNSAAMEIALADMGVLYQRMCDIASGSTPVPTMRTSK